MTTPIAITDSLSLVGNYAAEFRARIDTGNEVTSFYFEYDITSLFTSSSFTSANTLPASSTIIELTFIQNKLIVDTNYYVRVIATNASGTSTGTTKVFRTKSVLFNNVELDNIIESEKFTIQPVYRDFNQFTPQISPSLYDVAVIGQGVNNILTCRKKSRFFKNSFGSDLDEIPFEINDDDLLEEAMGYIIEATSRWEPRIYIDQRNTKITQYIDDYIFAIDIGFGLNLEDNKKYQINVRGLNNG